MQARHPSCGLRILSDDPSEYCVYDPSEYCVYERNSINFTHLPIAKRIFQALPTSPLHGLHYHGPWFTRGSGNQTRSLFIETSSIHPSHIVFPLDGAKSTPSPLLGPMNTVRSILPRPNQAHVPEYLARVARPRTTSKGRPPPRPARCNHSIPCHVSPMLRSTVTHLPYHGIIPYMPYVLGTVPKTSLQHRTDSNLYAQERYRIQMTGTDLHGLRGRRDEILQSTMALVVAPLPLTDDMVHIRTDGALHKVLVLEPLQHRPTRGQPIYLPAAPSTIAIDPEPPHPLSLVCGTVGRDDDIKLRIVPMERKAPPLRKKTSRSGTVMHITVAIVRLPYPPFSKPPPPPLSRQPRAPPLERHKPLNCNMHHAPKPRLHLHSEKDGVNALNGITIRTQPAQVVL
ncbi:hypothetical protein LEMA_P066650.1 [Plenodomus lingam JN3]|uniref:Uncharacterized protein n=1 Tax=Leptosphaeria maculans (strain JN3 / isolate v23.1.3 / race Av1-4-5-6-7-8) TaxID=985895 RepID=E4ZGW9_LEPMJ|nr:hypothetical protein LEMA_P066650.1 [Plenodomus lingam JN3]CBX90539.1 hypothetical protein LEMA_P066650.1 [Plenodomus lingam JN3]